MSTTHPITPSGLRLVGYARASSDQQERSVPQQKEWMQELARKHGHDLARVFEDDGIPGDKLRLADRKGFLALLDWVKAEHRAGRPVDGIICYVLSRFGRMDIFDTGAQLSALRDAGIRWLITSARTYDLHSDTDQIILAVEQTSEAKFSPTLARGVTRGQASQARAGAPVARAPYGYAVEYHEALPGKRPRPARWVIEPNEANVVRRIFRAYVSGQHSLRSIADMLNREGILSPFASRGCKARRKPVSGKWSVSGVRVILRNEAYLGHHVWNRRSSGKYACCIDGEFAERTPQDRGKTKFNDPSQHIRRENAHEPLVDVPTFDLAQRRLEQNGRSPAACRGNRRVYLFTGLVVCGKCQASMAPRKASGRQGIGYWCNGYAVGGRAACDCNRVHEGRMLAAISQALQERLDLAFLDGFEARVRIALAGQQDDAAGRLEALRATLTDVEAQLLVDVRQMMRAPEALQQAAQAVAMATQQRRDELAREVAVAEAASAGQQAQGQSVEDLVRDARAEVQRMHEVLRDGDRATVRAFFRDNVERIVVYFDPQVDGEKRERFDRALVYLRDESPLCSLLFTTMDRSEQYGQPHFVISRENWRTAL
jgi:DNA invertase Pin-like site-specific DNA recombinase